MSAVTVDLFTTLGATCGQVLCGEVLCGAPSDVYSLPDTMTLQGDGFTTRFRKDARTLGHGANVDASYVQEREIHVKGEVLSASTAAQVALLRAIRGAALKDDIKLRVASTEFLRLARPKSGPLTHEELTARMVSRVELAWEADDPFWYASSWSAASQQVTGNATMTVDTGTTPQKEMPCIVVVTPTIGTLGAVKLQNNTDASRWWSYSDTSASAVALVVDGRGNGSVIRAGASQIANFVGLWFNLRPGANTIVYTGAAAQIDFAWQARWI